MRFIIRILANSLAIYLAAFLVPGVTVGSPAASAANWKLFLLCGLVLSLINGIIKPLLKLISLPLIFVTFGLFSLVINIITIWLLTQIVSQITIAGIWSLVWTTIIVSVVNWFVNFLTKKSRATE